MTRKDLITAVHTNLDRVPNNKISKSDVERIVGIIFDKTIPDTLAEGEVVSINDFGKFEQVIKAARTGRNPQTGAACQIEEKAAVKFKPATALKNKLN
jgi:nucleoid DNA-binding protein